MGVLKKVRIYTHSALSRLAHVIDMLVIIHIDIKLSRVKYIYNKANIYS